MSLLPTMIVSTDSWHYRYAVWLRKYWGREVDLNFHHGCPYFWSTVGYTLAMVCTSWLALVGRIGTSVCWWAARMFDACFEEGTVYQWYGKPDAVPDEPTKLSAFISKLYESYDGFALSNGGTKTFVGIAFLVASTILALAGGGTVVGVHYAILHGVPAILHLIPELPRMACDSIVSICHGFLVLGDDLYWYAGLLGGFVEANAVSLSNTVWTEIVSISTSEVFWRNVALYGTYGLSGAAIASVVGYGFYEVITSDWMEARRVKAEEKAKIRLAAAQKLANRLEEEAYRRRVAKETAKYAARLKPREPLRVVVWFRKVKENLFGSTEYHGNQGFQIMGIFPFVKTMVSSAWDGVCPQVVFLTPEQIEEKKQAAEKAAQVRFTTLQRQRAEWHARAELAREIVCKRKGIIYVPQPFEWGTPKEMADQAIQTAKETVASEEDAIKKQAEQLYKDEIKASDDRIVQPEKNPDFVASGIYRYKSFAEYYFAEENKAKSPKK